MMINIQNYEAYLLDLMEGRLSSQEEGYLRTFLANHPELDSNLPADFRLFPAPTKTISKEKLYFNELNDENRKHFFIASIENLLTEKQEHELTRFLANNEKYQAEFDAFRQTIFVPESIQFNPKKNLHSIAKKPIFNFQWYRMAAVILLLVGLTYALNLFLSTQPKSLYNPHFTTTNLTIDPYEIQESMVKANSIPQEKGGASQEKKDLSSTKKSHLETAKIEYTRSEKRSANLIETPLRPKVVALNKGFKESVAALEIGQKREANEATSEIEPLEVSFQRLTFGEVAVSALMDRSTNVVSGLIDKENLSTKLNSLLGEGNYVEKKNGKRSKTQFSLGKLKIERIVD